MHLKSITIKGFKSFPDRTRLEFGPGVSVIVGPNGSGKSNITDAVLWALGEQSPLAVRGQSMQDVIFSGGHGVQARNEAEVELVLDNADGVVPTASSEVSILRRLDRAGEGEYRLNGAHCRLIDVLEMLSDTGLGKEAHSVISQGRVEAIVTSKPRDRRLLIEEAAGLGKHRKRRRRAQLKLERTEENLGRALDVEREARGRLRPLKRQAEAAELHERLERQLLEARWTLLRDDLRARGERLAEREAAAAAARAEREAVQAELEQVAARREEAEQALAQRNARHDAIAGRVLGARSARDRVAMRLDHARGVAENVAERSRRRVAELAALREQAGQEEDAGTARLEQLDAELVLLDQRRETELANELVELDGRRREAESAIAGLIETRAGAKRESEAAEAAVASAREALREAERAVEEARRDAAQVGAELAAVNQFLRSHAAAAGGAGALESGLSVEPGYELALAAALGSRLGAALAVDRADAERLLAGAGDEGASALVAPAVPHATPRPGTPPVPGARALAELIDGEPLLLAIAARLLVDTWVVDDLAELAESFGGTAVTRGGRVWRTALGELRQAPSGGRERALEQRNRREELLARTERAASAEVGAHATVSAAQAGVQTALDQLEAADARLRAAGREHAEATERERRVAWLIEQRRTAPDQGETAVRRAQLEGERAAELRAVERIERERRTRAQRIESLEAATRADEELGPQVERLTAALEDLGTALASRLEALEVELRADSEAGEALASALRACATEESGLQARLREHGDAVTTAEVGAQQARDQAAEAQEDLAGVAARLGLAADAADAALPEDERAQLHDRVERVGRRREALGPVNPLAAEEYRTAVERVEELETQRNDLETALRELGALIRNTDREIAESFEQTFEAAAANFEALVGDVFPGGRGRLRLVREEHSLRPVLGGEAPAEGTAAEEGAEREADEEESAGQGPNEQLGVEIEVTPAGKTMKRLSLLSGGEKSMTAIAFLFAVFLARPCPFYILDEVEAALDDLNIDRFLTLLRRHSERAQFIVVTHQKRTMEAADWLYGVSMGGDGTSKVVSRRLGSDGIGEVEADAA